jgi:hypothetical protein
MDLFFISFCTARRNNLKTFALFCDEKLTMDTCGSLQGVKGTVEEKMQQWYEEFVKR